MPAIAKPIAIPAADELLTGAPRILYGWSVNESDGTPAVASFLIRNGSASGQIVAAVELAANGSSTEWLGGVYCDLGIFIDRVTGTITGSIFVG